MKEKIALFIASLLIGFVMGGILYLFDIVNTSKEFFTYSIIFGIGSFLFELFIRPVINKVFKYKN